MTKVIAKLEDYLLIKHEAAALSMIRGCRLSPIILVGRRNLEADRLAKAAIPKSQSSFRAFASCAITDQRFSAEIAPMTRWEYAR